jgi:hypothetical protein
MTGRALRERYEVLQAQERELKASLETSRARWLDDAAHLAQEVEALERALTEREVRMRRVEARRPVSQRVAAFGFQVLFVAPIIAMVGVAVGRRLRHEGVAAVALLVAGVLVLVASVVRPLWTRLWRWSEPRWRVVRQARALLEAASRKDELPGPCQASTRRRKHTCRRRCVLS